MRKIIVICSIIAAGLAASGGLYAMKASAEQKIVDGLRSNVSAQMKDPVSTQFRNEKVKDGVMCGELNSKNGRGAYEGFKRFVSASPADAYVEGIGYVGKGDWSQKDSIDQAIDSLAKEQLPIWQSNVIEGRISPSKFQNIVEMKLFNKRWSEVCT